MRYKDLRLNEEAVSLVDDLIDISDIAEVRVVGIGDMEVIDCGVDVTGSLTAGEMLAEISMGGLGSVEILPGRLMDRGCPIVKVQTNVPPAACLLSQYAGWKISHEKFFAMGSGPMRAVRQREPIFERLPYSEEYETVVGVLESTKLPTEEVAEKICEELDVDPEDCILLVAPTASIAGSIQVVSRSIETCLHKLFELGYDLTRIKSAMGTAYLPPIPEDDLTAIARTNDSILYSAEVFLWLYGDDETIHELGSKVPSCTSPDYGESFAKIFERYDGDFYKIDPLLFSPAQVTFNNVATGLCETFGQVNHELLAQSFFGS